MTLFVTFVPIVYIVVFYYCESSEDCEHSDGVKLLIDPVDYNVSSLLGQHNSLAVATSILTVHVGYCRA